MTKPERHAVTTEIKGDYEVSDDGTIVVYYEGRKSNQTQVGGLSPYVLAQQISGELSREAPTPAKPKVV